MRSTVLKLGDGCASGIQLLPNKSLHRTRPRLSRGLRWRRSPGAILKFYLHISADEQLERFKKRLDDPTKQWKISESDYAERPHWDEYMRAYEEALSRCSTDDAPWFVIPANHKWFRNLAIARIIVEQLEEWHMSYPKPTVDLEHIRKEYHAAKRAE